jgi:3-methyladenine DNA glycosylase AlkC
MAEPLKNSFGPDIPAWISESLGTVDPDFNTTAFLADALLGYEELELTARARHVADCLADYLPADRAVAINQIVASLGPESPGQELKGMEPFRYLPYVYFVAEYGLDDFDESMGAQYVLTKRFTAEFSIRAFITRHPSRTMARLSVWAADPNVHVRRLVSEGTRPRLPWAPRLPQFQADPSPVLSLLDELKDDPEEYVRRSVANNLNDISKDHPQEVIDIAARWWPDSDANRRKLLRHGLRTLVKHGDPQALEILGYSANSPVEVSMISVDPPDPRIGGRIRIVATVSNASDVPAAVLVDLILSFVKANGSTSKKVFKGAVLTLAPRSSSDVKKTISLAQLSTRKHYPGVHKVEVQLNGSIVKAAEFSLRPAVEPAH